jgi:hypothetical protein
MTGELSTIYRDLLNQQQQCQSYGYERVLSDGHDPGGFRVWWRAPTGSEETLKNA